MLDDAMLLMLLMVMMSILMTTTSMANSRPDFDHPFEDVYACTWPSPMGISEKLQGLTGKP